MTHPVSSWESNNRNDVLEDVAQGKRDGRYKDCVHLYLAEAHAIFRGDSYRFSTACDKDSLLIPRKGDHLLVAAAGLRIIPLREPCCPDPCHSFEMTTEQKQFAEVARRRDEAVSAIDAQLATLDNILSDHSTLPGYESGTERTLLRESLERWALNTEQTVRELVDETEAKRFRDRRRAFHGNLEVGTERCRSFLLVLKQSLIANPKAQFGRASTPAESMITTSPKEKAVFIVHGHDEANALKLDALIRDRFKLRTIVLRFEANRGRTLIDKFEQEAARANFALVLLSPDDLIDVKDAPYLQARPNVFFELGWFYGRLGRERTTIVWKRGGKLPTDLDGVGRVEFTTSVDEAYLELERELAAAEIIQEP